MKKAIVITSDHAGYEMKKTLIPFLNSFGYEVVDVGTDNPEAADYPDFGHRLGLAIESGDFSVGISICGSGNGINMTSNKHKGVRAALCWTVEIAELARKHNDANVCSLPARFIDIEMAKSIVMKFLTTEFDGGRHLRRRNKIDI